MFFYLILSISHIFFNKQYYILKGNILLVLHLGFLGWFLLWILNPWYKIMKYVCIYEYQYNMYISIRRQFISSYFRNWLRPKYTFFRIVMPSFGDNGFIRLCVDMSENPECNPNSSHVRWKWKPHTRMINIPPMTFTLRRWFALFSGHIKSQPLGFAYIIE